MLEIKNIDYSHKIIRQLIAGSVEPIRPNPLSSRKKEHGITVLSSKLDVVLPRR
jgi:hypothetical protein